MSNKKNKSKMSQIKNRSYKMSVSNNRYSEKTRLVLTCTEDEKVYIKMLAAKERKTISEYLLSFPRARMPKSACNFPGCNGIHKPNKLTEKVLRESEKGENLEHHESLEDFWKSMGIDLNATD